MMNYKKQQLKFKTQNTYFSSNKIVCRAKFKIGYESCNKKLSFLKYNLKIIRQS